MQDTLTAALEHHRDGRLREAETIYRRILQQQPNHPDALHLLGVLAHQTGNHRVAVELIEQAIRQRPDQADYQSNLGLALDALEEHRAAAAAYRRALVLEPDSAALHCSYGASLQNLGELDEAVASYRQALQLDPGYADAHYNLGTALKEQGRAAEAVSAYRQALTLRPDAAHVSANIAGVLLEQGRLDDALDECARCLAIEPGNRLAMAYQAVAAQELGDRILLGELLDFDALLKPVALAAPAGYAGMNEFNVALSDHVRHHPTLRYQPALQATRFGTHTGELLSEPKGPIAALETLIIQAIADYVDELPASRADHPFVANMPREFDLTVWAVVMSKQGHQLPHIHGDGYVSGVYYPSLPDAIRDGDANHAGWIEFGRPPEQFACRAQTRLRLIRPQPGLLVLFPSYFYHRTIPFHTEEERISIAFDALPAQL